MRIHTFANYVVMGMFAGLVAIATDGTLNAQTPQPTAHERAAEATMSELQQAWVAARTAWISSQDENARLSAQLKAMTEKVAQLEAERAKSLPPPDTK